MRSRRRIKQCELAKVKRQMLLSIQKDKGDTSIVECVCGNLFNNMVYAKSGHFKGTKRQYCVGCTMRPATRIRKKWSKKQQAFVEYEVRR